MSNLLKSTVCAWVHVSDSDIGFKEWLFPYAVFSPDLNSPPLLETYMGEEQVSGGRADFRGYL